MIVFRAFRWSDERQLFGALLGFLNDLGDRRVFFRLGDDGGNSRSLKQAVAV